MAATHDVHAAAEEIFDIGGDSSGLRASNARRFSQCCFTLQLSIVSLQRNVSKYARVESSQPAEAAITAPGRSRDAYSVFFA